MVFGVLPRNSEFVGDHVDVVYCVGERGVKFLGTCGERFDGYLTAVVEFFDEAIWPLRAFEKEVATFSFDVTTGGDYSSDRDLPSRAPAPN